MLFAQAISESTQLTITISALLVGAGAIATVVRIWTVATVRQEAQSEEIKKLWTAMATLQSEGRASQKEIGISLQKILRWISREEGRREGRDSESSQPIILDPREG